jgi:hypothetical protein
MATSYEKAFIQHLVLPDSLAIIVRMDMPHDIFPTEVLRPVFVFALDYWHAESTEGTAPSPDAMREHFAALLADHEIDLDVDPENILTWAVECLRGNFIDRHTLTWTRKFAGSITEAELMGKPGVLDDAINDLMAVQLRVSGGVNERVDVREGMASTLDSYFERVAMRLDGRVTGLSFGFAPVDTHTSGIRPAELAVLAAPPKAGKSFMLAAAAKKAWDDGLVPVLFTLENSVEMTLDRIACYVMGVDGKRWQRGEATPDEVERVRVFVALMKDGSHPFHVVQPPLGQRTVSHMIRHAKALGDVAIIDQLTFIEPNPDHVRLPRYQQVGHSLHELKGLISTGKRIPCLLAHQINREGQKAAEKAGRLEMYHLAESAEVERTADWVIGLWSNRSMVDAGRCYLQTLASRRADLINWEMIWRPWAGQAQVLREVRLEGAE